jgi:hypothetical protein
MRPQFVALAVVSGLLFSYYIWSLFVGSRYQALCNVTYLQASREQIASCKEAKTELDNAR